MELCNLHHVLSTDAAGAQGTGAASGSSGFISTGAFGAHAAPAASAGGSSNGNSAPQVNLAALRCCEHYQVVLLGLVDHRLLVRYSLPDAKQSEDALTFVVPLPEKELEPITALDLSEDAEYLAAVSEDATILVVPLLELMCLYTPSWADLITSHRPTRQQPKLVARERGTLEILTDQLLTDLFGASTTGGSDADSAALRFSVDASREDAAAVTSVVWWTREFHANASDLTAELNDDEMRRYGPGGTEMTGAPSAPVAEYFLIMGSLSGRLSIVDLLQQKEVRSFNLAPIVWLQRCQSRCQEWLLIETAVEPRYWKMLLSTSIEQQGPAPLRWSIVDGVALPTSASEQFELEPLGGLPPLYQLLVLRKGRSEDGQDAHSAGDGAVAVAAPEVLGMLVADAAAPAPPEGMPAPLCLMLSLVSFPEEPLARIDLPISASPPGAPGKRRLADVLLLFGGRLVLSVVHVLGAHTEGAAGEQIHTKLILSTGKPWPCAGDAALEGVIPTETPNTVIQEFDVAGKVVGGAAGYSFWVGSGGSDALSSDCVAHSASCGVGAGGAGDLGGCSGAGGQGQEAEAAGGLTTLAVVWTLSRVYELRGSASRIIAGLQAQSLLSFADIALPEADPGGGDVRLDDAITAQDGPAEALTNGPSTSSAVGSSEQFEAALPNLCWAFDVDLDALMLSAGEQAFLRLSSQPDALADNRLLEAREQAVRAALSLWARRSTKLVPLPMLMECFGQLAQSVEIVRLCAPAILQVLMPHWPSIASAMETMSSEFDTSARQERARLSKPPPVGAMDFSAHSALGSSIGALAVPMLPSRFPEPKSRPVTPEASPQTVGPSAVAWFLSLAVMLLVIMHPRTTAAREYTRRGRGHEAKAPLPGARDFASEWQAWVSERVALMLSGGCGRPHANFALLADHVQQDFEDWWKREWRELHDRRIAVVQKDVASPTGAGAAVLDGVADAEAEAEGDGDASPAAAPGATPPAAEGELHPVAELQQASPSKPRADVWVSRMLLLTALRLHCLDLQACGEIGELFRWLVGRDEGGDTGGVLAISALIASHIRGLRLWTSHAAPPFPGVGGATAGPSDDVWSVPAKVQCGVDTALRAVQLVAAWPSARAADACWRLLWATLSPLGAHGQSVPAELHGGAQPVGLALWVPTAFTGSTPNDATEDVEPVPAGDAEPGSEQGGSEPDEDIETSLFRALGKLPRWGFCIACESEWRWEHEDSAAEAVLRSVDAAGSAESFGTEGARGKMPVAGGTEAALAFRAIECWMAESSPLPSDGEVGGSGPPDAPLPTDEKADTASSEEAAEEDGWKHGPLLREAAAWEEAVYDSGAAEGERLGRAAWWPHLCARFPSALPTLVLAAMAAEHEWVWSLPWTPTFRLHLSRALFLMRAEALSLQPTSSTVAREVVLR